MTWYRDAFVILHADHHTREDSPVGKDADEEATREMIARVDPDLIQIHAKGNPGWTTYPTDIGFTPPGLQKDVLRMWKTIADERGKPFSAYYNLGRDGEIMMRRPELNRLDAGGNLRQNMLSYGAAVGREYLWPQLDEIMDRYDPAGFWFDGSCFTVCTCYQEATVSRWREESGMEPPRTPDAPGWDGFKELQRELYRELVRDTCRFVHEKRPGCLVAVNVAYGILMPEKPDAGIDYLTADIADHVERVGSAASIMDAQRLPFDLMVALWYSTAESIADIKEKRFPKPLSQLQQEAAIIISRGGRFSAWETPTQGSGLYPENMSVLADVTDWLRPKKAWCLESYNLPDVSFMHAPETHYANTRNAANCFLNSAPSLTVACALLDMHHVPYEVLPGWRLEEHDIDGKLLVIEDPHVVTEKQLSGLNHYLKAGGRVLLTGDALVAGGPELRALAGVGRVRPTSTSSTFSFEVGTNQPVSVARFYRAEPGDCRVVMWASAGDAITSGNETASPVTKLGFGEMAWPLEEESPGRYPLLTEYSGVFYCAVPIHAEIAAAGNDPAYADPALTTLWNTIVGAALSNDERTIATTAPGTLHVTLREQPGHDRLVMHLVNAHPGCKTAGTIFPKIEAIETAPTARYELRIDFAPSRVTIEPDGAKIDYTYENGALSFSIDEFDIHLMVVIQR